MASCSVVEPGVGGVACCLVGEEGKKMYVGIGVVAVVDVNVGVVLV